MPPPAAPTADRRETSHVEERGDHEAVTDLAGTELPGKELAGTYLAGAGWLAADGEGWMV